MRHGEVTRLWVNHTVQQAAIDKHPAANPGSNRQVHENIQPAPIAPMILAQSSTVHICIKTNRQMKCLLQHPHQVGAGPTRLGCGKDLSVSG